MSEEGVSTSDGSSKTSSHQIIQDFLQDKIEAGDSRKSVLELRAMKRQAPSIIGFFRVLAVSLFGPSSRAGTGNEAVLQDESGVITIVGSQKFNEFFKTLTSGSAYILTHFKIDTSLKGCHLSMLKETSARQVLSFPEVEHLFVGEPSWTPVKDITEKSRRSGMYPNTFGTVQSIANEPRDIYIKGHPSKVKAATIADETGSTRVSLFGEQASLTGTTSKIFALFHGSIAIYNGEISISSHFLWDKPYGMPSILALLTKESLPPTELVVEISKPIYTEIELDEIPEMESELGKDGLNISFVAKVDQFINIGTSAYYACKDVSCSKSLTDNMKGAMFCVCGKKYPESTFPKRSLLKFKLQASVIQDGTDQNVTIWEDGLRAGLTGLGLGDTLSDYKCDEGGDMTLGRLFAPLMDTVFTFKGKVKRNEYKDKVYMNIGVVDMSPVLDAEELAKNTTPAKRRGSWKSALESSKKKLKQ